MNIAIIGTGYVGLVSGTCFAEIGNNVVCIDVDNEKIEKLSNCIIPIYEPGLNDMINRNVANDRLHFSTSLKDIIDNIDILFCAVGTPMKEDGSANLDYVLSVAKEVGQIMNKYILFVTKSTVPVGTSKIIKNTIQEQLDIRNANIQFDVASNPEFLKEGDAINDFMSPDRVIIGVENEHSKTLLSRLYRPFLLNNFRIIFMDIESAEMTKHTANAMLATRISFMNEISNLCELTGADINSIRKGIGSDNRIGSKFLYAGCGYGGSCFPKDIKALTSIAQSLGYNMKLLSAVDEINNNQKHILYKKLVEQLGSLNGKRIAVWGIAFKPNTDDIREAPSLTLFDDLLESGASVIAYDPIVKKTTRAIEYANDMYDALLNADALVLVTEWKIFKNPDWEKVKQLMKNPLVVDGRNIYDIKELCDAGFIYKCIGVK